jgi:lactate permease
MDLIASLAPIVLLVWLMTKPRAVPSQRALPLAALAAYLLKVFWFGDAPRLVHATVVQGLLEAWTPILIIWGAILLFRIMDASGAMAVVRTWLNGISVNPVAQLMIIGWAFSFMIEGASGFGTPAALAAPILVGLGFPPFRVAVFALVMNSVPVSFGAVGTPTWFGMGQLGLTEQQLLATGFRTALINGAAARVVPALALRVMLPWREIRANLGFVVLAVLACTVPYVALAAVSYEFPALIGGVVGLIVTVLTARRGVGLAGPRDEAVPAAERVPLPALVKALSPIWITVLVLVATRVEQLGLKALLTDPRPVFTAGLGPLGQLSVSPALVIRLTDIFGAPVAWNFQALYVPALIPFFLVSALSVLVFRMSRPQARAVLDDTRRRMRNPILALLGALVMVKLLMAGDGDSMVITIGDAFAAAAGPVWPFVASYLGALGAFFSGSATISNLTFAGIQDSIATGLGLDRTVMLALQAAGAAMGNMVCINNIVAVCSILGVVGREGDILKKTVVPMLVYGVVAAVVGQVLLRF